MKRQHISLEQLAARDNLLLATWKAARGRASRPAAQRFVTQLDANLSLLAQGILDETVPQGSLRRFVIHDPKRREIAAPCFADRVLHHAILNLAEERFERALVSSSFACRPGMGVHAAVLAAQAQLQRYSCWLQVDVAGYFPSIDHALLLELLARRFKGTQFLALLGRVVNAGAEGDMGLPIGALTSQHFANAYLDDADRWLLAHNDVRGHLRYMDDILCWCDSLAQAREVAAQLRAHLWRTRRLRLKDNPGFGHSRHGVRFCGFRIKPGVVLPSQRKLERFTQAASRWVDAVAAGKVSQADAQRASDVLHATLAHTQSERWRQTVWAQRNGYSEST
jgi:RNA-directed DNA polymerase